MNRNQRLDAVEIAVAVVRDDDGKAVARDAAVSPTQVRYPGKATLRGIFQGAVGLASMWAIVVATLGLPDWAWVGASLAVAGGITRLMAVPQVELWLRSYFPWLSAAPKPSLPALPPTPPVLDEPVDPAEVVEQVEDGTV